jgi:hypothetical protein
MKIMRNSSTGLKEPSWILDKDYHNIKRLLVMKSMGGDDIILMESLIRKYIDGKCKICRHCPAQVKFAHKRLTSWWELNGKNLFVRDEKGCFVSVG